MAGMMPVPGLSEAASAIRQLAVTKRRNVTEIIVHCSATPAGRDIRCADIRQWHIADRKFSDIGYHFVIDLDGTIEHGRPLQQAGAHCIRHNRHSIGICYVGGTDSCGQAADTRTTLQKISLKALIQLIRNSFDRLTVHGHRDFAAKACPCFDAASEYGKP